MYGKGLWMTLSQSLSHHTRMNSWNISIQLISISNSQLKIKEVMEPCHFLDILITPGEDGSLSTSVFRKPTHTDLYLHWDSHHILTSKYSVIGTLQHRAQTICSNPQLLQKEEQHLQSALKKCKYPNWALTKIRIKAKKPPTNKDQNKELTPRTIISHT